MNKKYLEDNNLYYNLSTGSYIKFFGEHLHLYPWPKGKTRNQAIKYTNDLILQDGRLRSESNVIDLGCGIGSLSLLIASRYSCKITAININSHQLDIAKKRSREKRAKIHFIQQDIMELRLKEHFNTCFMIDVEPHLPNKLRAMNSIKNLLKPGGRLVMTAWLQPEKTSFFQKEMLIKPYCKIAAFPFLETFGHYKSYFIKNNFKIIKFKDITEETKRTVDYYYFLGLKLLNKYNSIGEIAKLVLDKNLISTLLKKAGRESILKTAENIFLGPVYTKLCMDAQLLKIGYFVVEKL